MEDNDKTAGVDYEMTTSGDTSRAQWTTIASAPYTFGRWEVVNPHNGGPNVVRLRYNFQEENEEEMAKNGTRQLYNVFVVDPEGDGKVVFEKKNIIAVDDDAAKMKTVHDPDCKLSKDLDDYDFIVEDVGDWGSIRPKA
jgi:hypothetical protein